MKLCIQRLNRSILLLAVAAVSACGGGSEPVATPIVPTMKVSVPFPAKKAATVAGGNGVVIHMYQALYGFAPSNALLVDYAFQANNDASTFVKNLTDRFANTSHAELAKLVLDNLGVSPKTVTAINAKGESEFALLLDAVQQLFAAYPTMRGQVILNMTNLLAELETDATYGDASSVYNRQASANFSYSSSSASDASTVVTLPPSPTVILNSSSASSYQGDSVTLTWSSMNATSCTASGGWAGTLATSGTQSVSVTALGVNNYSISCANSNDKATTSASISSTVKPYFAQTPVLMPDVSSYYTRLCGTRTNVQSAVAVDLNNDGRKDLLFTFWCGQAQNGVYQPASIPVQNTIVAFEQLSDGTFIDATLKVFGQSLPDMGGIATTGMVADLNGDGLPDIVFNVTHEDGRSPDPVTGDATNQYSKNVVLLSQGGGKYSIVPYGPSYWWVYGNLLMTNSTGRTDVYSAGSYGQVIVYKFPNNAPIDVTDESVKNLSGVIMFFSSNNAATDSAILHTGNTGRLELHRKVSGTWSQMSNWSLTNVRFVPWTSWQNGHGDAPLITIDGQDYVDAVLNNGCIYKPTPTSEARAIVGMFSYKLIGNYQGGGVVEGLNMEHSFKLMSFTISNGILQNTSIKINNEQTNIREFSIQCLDVNGDGYDDILMTTWGHDAKPIIYLNDGTGVFNFVELATLPNPITTANDSSMILQDINGDGIPDLVYWALTGVQQYGTGPVNYYFYPGLKPLR